MKDNQTIEDSKLAEKAIAQLKQRASQLIAEQNNTGQEKLAGRKLELIRSKVYSSGLCRQRIEERHDRGSEQFESIEHRWSITDFSRTLFNEN